ncbi:THAP domain-containing protein 6-like [Aphis craccivora]|uniref:THAP domain-containing protein 6-like n=1 Tax=Aphis craccivora TaxID=307492 RepID=A0A6G0YWU4_APHCR|nr:THAP domain-containing protein 6-like [Aphis craccivora]
MQHFPKDMVLCEKRVAEFQKDYQFEVKKSYHICSKHFEEEHFIKKNLPNMMDDISGINIPIIEYSSDSDNNIVVESENIDNENQILSMPQKDSSKKKRKLLRYCGDFCKHDLEKPRKRKLFWNAYQKSCQE